MAPANWPRIPGHRVVLFGTVSSAIFLKGQKEKQDIKPEVGYRGVLAQMRQTQKDELERQKKKKPPCKLICIIVL